MIKKYVKQSISSPSTRPFFFQCLDTFGRFFGRWRRGKKESHRTNGTSQKCGNSIQKKEQREEEKTKTKGVQIMRLSKGGKNTRETESNSQFVSFWEGGRGDRRKNEEFLQRILRDRIRASNPRRNKIIYDAVYNRGGHRTRLPTRLENYHPHNHHQKTQRDTMFSPLLECDYILSKV